MDSKRVRHLIRTRGASEYKYALVSVAIFRGEVLHSADGEAPEWRIKACNNDSKEKVAYNTGIQ